ncbi:MAG: tetratricopeptide repeat protein [Candidatus Pacebacteria bacterium]|nr:tetratricopeptide repeat protein [Candidatus Paceibacterota bacterium]
MDVIKKRKKSGNEIKIDISNKTDFIDVSASEENEAIEKMEDESAAEAIRTEQSAAPDIYSGGGRKTIWEKILVKIFYALILLIPLFVLPLAASPFSAGKGVLFYGAGVSLLFLWLMAGFQKRKISFPKSFLLYASWLMALAWLVAAFFADNPALSLTGKIYETDTFAFLALAVFMMYLASVYFQKENRVPNAYKIIFASALTVALFQIAHLFFGASAIIPGMFPLKNSNLVGGWTDFSIFLGFAAILATFSGAASRGENAGKRKKFLYFLAALFAATLAFSASFLVWTIFCSVSFVIFLYFFLENIGERKLERKGFSYKTVLSFPFFIFLISAFFVGDGSLNNSLFASKLSGLAGTSFVEVRPDWSATKHVIGEVFKTDSVLGSGPNTFSYDWIKFKPLAVNATMFWNARFSSGVGYFPSVVATAGIVGGLAAAIFLAAFLVCGAKIFSRKSENRSGGSAPSADNLLKSSFLGAAYLWSFEVFYSGGLAVLFLAFIFTGFVVALMIKEKITRSAEKTFERKTKSGFAHSAVSIILLLGAVSLGYFYFQKISAVYAYNKAVSVFSRTGDAEKASALLEKAAKMDKQDEYYRLLSEINLVRLGQAVSGSGKDASKASVAEASLASAIKYASEAALKLNPAEPANWMQLGKIYEAVMPLIDPQKSQEAEASAINAYAAAISQSPSDPSPFLAAARVAINRDKLEEAKKYLQSSLSLKPNFVSALFMLAQIEAQSGNLNEAIAATEQAASSSQNDPSIFFQLGLLYYQAKEINLARLAFERAVLLDGNYANARYFLGIIYDKQGMKEQALAQFESVAQTNPDNEEVKKIIGNLKSDRSALNEISPPGKSPEKRAEPPVEEEGEESQ